MFLEPREQTAPASVPRRLLAIARPTVRRERDSLLLWKTYANDMPALKAPRGNTWKSEREVSLTESVPGVRLGHGYLSLQLEHAQGD